MEKEVKLIVEGRPIGEDFDTPFTAEPGGRTVSDIVTVMITASVVGAGIVSLFLMIIGGLGIIQGAGSGSRDRTAKGRLFFTWGVAGFFVIFAAYWVIRLLEVITGNTFVTNPNLPI